MHEEFPDPQLPKARPVIGWPGGKRRLLKHLLPLLPVHLCYCEVFGGGLALFLAKQPSDIEVVNDINSELVKFYRNARTHLEPLLDELDLLLNSREDFEDYGAQPGLTELQRSARWFVRNILSFGGMGKNFGTGKTQPRSSRTSRLLALRSLAQRLDRTTIEHVPWDKCLDIYDSPDTCFFVDPPYLDSGGGAYDGWSEHELTRFCHRLPRLAGKWIFTFQDCEQVRDLMAGFQITGIERANGIGNRGKKTGRKYHEVIITNERDEFTAARKGMGA